MLLKFFEGVRKAGVPATVRELLTLLEALDNHLAYGSVENFYLLSRTCLVKDEKYYDRFDRAFSLHFEELETLDDFLEALIPEEWLRQEFERSLTQDEKDKIQSLGGLENLIEQFKKRLEEQKKRHEGGNKWIGTGGTSPFGHGGFNQEGIRIGGDGQHKRAVKIWEKRDFKNLDDDEVLGARNIKLAMRRLRKFARTGAPEELDMDDTIRSTAKNAGYLDLKMVPERHNAVKVLIFFDVGGSMDPFVRTCEEMFSAARTEFKHLEYFYFHNMFYDYVWKDNKLRHNERTRTFDLLHKYSADYKVIIVGDASMAPYEITSAGGCIEYHNTEPGAVWLNRLTSTYEKLAWLNPVPDNQWEFTRSIDLVKKLVDDRMFPMTLHGLEDAMNYLSR